MCHYTLSSNPNITIDNVINHPEIEWCHEKLIKNENVKKDLTFDLILAQIDENDLFVRILKLFLLDCQISDELVEKMRELIGKFYEKCETEIANVVVSHMEQGQETNYGLRQKIRKYL